MPAGSAACLPMPQELLPTSSFAQRPRFTRLLEPSGLPTLPRRLPMQKAADDPPRGRILVAWNDTQAALQLQRLLNELDYAVVGPAGCRDEVERLIARSTGFGRPIECALVHAGVPDAAMIAARLADQTVPLVWLVPTIDAVPPAHAHAPILDRPFDRVALVAAIDEATRQKASRSLYAVPPPQPAWPRVFPQL